MDNSTAAQREQGIQAFREGDLEKAVELLVRAVMADDNDAESRAVLGIVYSQKGLHDQAKRALQNAVALEPQNAKFIYNLGLARERAGDMQGAAVAFADTLKIDPHHAPAKARLEAMGPQAAQYLASAPKPSEPVGVPHTRPEAEPPGGLNAPTAAGPMGTGVTPTSAPPALGLAAGSGSSGVGTEETGPAGTVKCDACGQWSQIGMTCEFCSSALKPPAPIAHAAPSTYTPVAAGAGVGGGGSTWYEDKFEIGQAYVDWLNVLVRPGEFFKEQGDREGLNAPLSFLFACGIIVGVADTLIRLAMRMVGMIQGGSVSFFGAGMRGACMGISLCILMFICSGFVHVLVRLFGGQAGYSGTFRAVAYAGAPITLFFCLGTLLNPVIQKAMMPPELRKTALVAPAPERSRASLARAEGGVLVAQAGGGAPTGAGRSRSGAGARPGAAKSGPNKGDVQKIGNVISAFATMFGVMIALQLPGYVWAWCLLSIALMHIHRVSLGSAISVVAVSVAVIAGIAGTLFFVFSQAIAGFMGIASGVAGAGGAGGMDAGEDASLDEEE